MYHIYDNNIDNEHLLDIPVAKCFKGTIHFNFMILRGRNSNTFQLISKETGLEMLHNSPKIIELIISRINLWTVLVSETVLLTTIPYLIYEKFKWT